MRRAFLAEDKKRIGESREKQLHVKKLFQKYQIISIFRKHPLYFRSAKTPIILNFLFCASECQSKHQSGGVRVFLVRRHPYCFAVIFGVAKLNVKWNQQS